MITGFDLGKARVHMEQQGLDCLVATSHDNVYYSSGSEIMTITMLKRLAAVFIPRDGEPVFGVHANERVTAEQSTWINDLRVYVGGEWEPLKPIDFVADTLKEMGYKDKRIGVETLDIPSVCYDYLRKQLPDTEFTDCQPVFDRMRAIKSSEELKHMSRINMATAKTRAQSQWAYHGVAVGDRVLITGMITSEIQDQSGFYLLQTDNMLNKEWEHAFGLGTGTYCDFTSDGGIIVTGTSLYGGHGGKDIRLVKIGPEPGVGYNSLYLVLLVMVLITVIRRKAWSGLK